ncbi:MAG TPA: DegT/DnrJ/EryC1/StrS family aminotransferase [Actinocatenispora sp.]
MNTPEPVPFLDLHPMTAEALPAIERYWADIAASGRFVGGELVERFEQEWAAYCGTEHAVGVANGTDALHLSLRALGVGPGDEVVVPANTFVATAEAVVLAGATPRFADVDDATLLVTPSTVEDALTSRTRAVIAVHLYGQMPDMAGILAVTRRAGVPLVEDAAQAQGASWRGIRAGAYGAVGCFSFYPGKNLGAFGDAGAVVTGDAGIAAALRSLRDHGRAPGEHVRHVVIGTNSRLDAVQAAVLLAKLPLLDGWNAARRRVAARYAEELAELPVRLVPEAADAHGVYHLAVVRVADRDRFRARLAGLGVGTGVHYPTACHEMPPYEAFWSGPLPVAELAATEIVSLPMFPHLTDEQVRRVVKAVGEACDDD